MLPDPPAGARLLNQVQLNHVAAAARAQQGRSPQVRLFAGDVERGWFQQVGEFIDAFIPKSRLAGATQRRPQPFPD
jgi:hypothetical protein